MTGFKKKIWILFTLCLVVVVIFITFSKLYARTDGSRLFSGTRPPVNFLNRYHESHMEDFDCTDCHHKYVHGKNVLDEDSLEEGNPDILCSSCHNKKTKITLTMAFHEECIGCHNKLSTKGEKTGPSLCGGCHIRQKNEAAGPVHGGKNG